MTAPQTLPLPLEIRRMVYDLLISACNEEYNPWFILNYRETCKSVHQELTELNLFSKLVWDLQCPQDYQPGTWSGRTFRRCRRRLDSLQLKDSISSVYLQLSQDTDDSHMYLKQAFWAIIIQLPQLQNLICSSPYISSQNNSILRQELYDSIPDDCWDLKEPFWVRRGDVSRRELPPGVSWRPCNMYAVYQGEADDENDRDRLISVWWCE